MLGLVELAEILSKARKETLEDVLKIVNSFDENPSDNYGPAYGAALEDMRQAIRKLKQE